MQDKIDELREINSSIGGGRTAKHKLWMEMVEDILEAIVTPAAPARIEKPLDYDLIDDARHIPRSQWLDENE